MKRKFKCAPVSQIGSLYFKDDVQADLRDRPLFRPGSLPKDDPELYRKLDAAKDKYRIHLQIVNGGGRNDPTSL